METKLLLNSTISNTHKGAKFISADIKDHFLATPMKNPEFMYVKYKYILEDIHKRYNLYNKVISNDYIYIRIKKGMLGLKQVALLAYEYLKKLFSSI